VGGQAHGHVTARPGPWLARLRSGQSSRSPSDSSSPVPSFGLVPSNPATLAWILHVPVAAVVVIVVIVFVVGGLYPSTLDPNICFDGVASHTRVAGPARKRADQPQREEASAACAGRLGRRDGRRPRV